MQDSEKQDKPTPADETVKGSSTDTTDAANVTDTSETLNEAETRVASQPAESNVDSRDNSQTAEVTETEKESSAAVASNTASDRTSPANTFSTSSTGTPETSSRSPSAPARKSSLGILLVALIVLFGLAGMGYWGWMQFQALQDDLVQLRNQQAILKQGSSQQQQQLASLSTGQTASVETLGKLEAKGAEQHKQLTYLSTQMASLTGVRKQDWEIARLEYLLRLASQRLQLDGDLEGARSTMIAADEYLKFLDDPRLLPVRQQVAKDLLTLSQSNRVDRAGLYLQLDSLIELIPTLQPDTPEFEVTPVEEVSAEDLGFFEWVAKKLTGLVRLTTNDVKPAASWLSPDAKAQFNAMLSLRLMHAQQAVMAEDQKVYDAALAQAKTIAEEVYLGRKDAQVFVEQISALQQKRVSMDELDISGSHQALKEYLEAAQAAIRNTMLRSMIQGQSGQTAGEGN